MAVRTILSTEIPEKSTARYTATIKDETGAAIAAASLTTLTLTLFAESAGHPIINAVDHVNVLNTGRGTVDANGLVTITLQPADNVLVVAAADLELHVMLLEFTWAAGTKSGRHEVAFQVVGMPKVS